MSKLKIIVCLEYLGLEQKPPIKNSTPSGILFFALINYFFLSEGFFRGVKSLPLAVSTQGTNTTQKADIG